MPDEVVDKIGQKANNPVSDVHRVFVYINPNGYNKPTNTENARNPFNVKKIQKLMNDILIASGSDTRMTLIETTNAKDMFDLGFQQTWKGTEYFDHYVEFSDQMLSETGLPVGLASNMRGDKSVVYFEKLREAIKKATDAHLIILSLEEILANILLHEILYHGVLNRMDNSSTDGTLFSSETPIKSPVKILPQQVKQIDNRFD